MRARGTTPWLCALLLALAALGATRGARADDREWEIRPRAFFGLGGGVVVGSSGYRTDPGYSFFVLGLEAGVQIGDWMGALVQSRFWMGELPSVEHGASTNLSVLSQNALLFETTLASLFQIAVGPAIDWMYVDLWAERMGSPYYVGGSLVGPGFAARMALVTGGTGPGGRRGLGIVVNVHGSYAENVSVWTIDLSFGPELF